MNNNLSNLSLAEFNRYSQNLISESHFAINNPHLNQIPKDTIYPNPFDKVKPTVEANKNYPLPIEAKTIKANRIQFNQQ